MSMITTPPTPSPPPTMPMPRRSSTLWLARWLPNRMAASGAQALAHECLALVALQLLLGRLGVAALHLLLLGGLLVIGFQAVAHERFALVALHVLPGRLRVAILHLLLLGGRLDRRAHV